MGAGKEQIPLIKAIHREGHRVAAVDVSADADGVDLCDSFQCSSNRDVDAAESYARWIGVSGVMAAGTEVPDVMAIMAHRLSLPGIPVAAGVLLKDKLAYKKVLKAAGVPHTEAHCVHRGAIKAVFDELRYEVVLKPQIGSGSRGVSLVQNAPMELDIAYTAAEEVCGDVVMERYQPGPQISAETLIVGGVAITVAYVDRFYDGFAREVGGSSPSEWESERWKANKLIEDAALALGIVSGTIKSDLVLTEEGPKIIEMTCRLSGGPLSAIVNESSGVDYMREAVRIACGLEPVWDRLVAHDPKQVAVDMNGDKMDWDWSRRFIVKDLGRVSS